MSTMKFQYRSGQQPLAGYTIKRGIGLGGFGEVYFAVTDGGKEVALKWIRSNFDIEMRGVQQCLNLKHPNLVHLYDVRTDSQGAHWLVMEYIAGEPLSAILARHPNGVAPELAVQWFQGLAQAIHCLHEHGIVHRDLKPGNIFLEHGLIKIGDYGLCKYIADSQHAGMTKDVGTVHYMAPEISTGNYNRQIDIYAAGILLYEMLTGHVPFEGESAGEILMKHLTSIPNLNNVPKAFVPILTRALDKNPAHRFQTINEMAKQVAAVISPQDERDEPATRKTVVAPPTQSVPSSDIPSVIPVTNMLLFQQGFGELSGMLLSSVLFAALLAVGWALFYDANDYSKMVPIFFVVVAASWSVMISSKLWPTSPQEESWARRLLLMTLGFGIGAFALWLDGYELPLSWKSAPLTDVMRPWEPEPGQEPLRRNFFGRLYGTGYTSMSMLACYLSYFGLMFLLLRWWKTTEERRGKRFSFKPVLAVGFWAYILLFLLPAVHHREIGFVSLVMTAVVCQLSSPWREAVPVRKKKMRLATA